MEFFVTLLVFISTVVVSTGLYVDHGDPYELATLQTMRFTLRKSHDHSPLHTTVITPTIPGDYAVAFFVTGLDGLLSPDMYQMYLNDVAQHGFIVTASDYISPGSGREVGTMDEHRLGFITDAYMKQFYWLKEKLQGFLSTYITNVTSNFDHVGLFSHSAGADAVFKMAERNHTLFKGIVFYEPFSYMFNKPTSFSLPALIVGTQLSTARSHECIIPGFGYNHFYKMWGEPPKILMDVENFGHCDILDDPFQKFCTDVKACLGGNSSYIPAYHRFAQGVTSAFFIASLQGLTEDFRYVADEKNIPLPLDEFKTNMTSLH